VDSSAAFLEVALAKPTASGYKTLRFAVFDRKVTEWGRRPPSGCGRRKSCSRTEFQINPGQSSHVVELRIVFGSFLKCGYVDSKPTGKLFLSERN
jgi:hypothetical protein